MKEVTSISPFLVVVTKYGSVWWPRTAAGVWGWRGTETTGTLLEPDLNFGDTSA